VPGPWFRRREYRSSIGFPKAFLDSCRLKCHRYCDATLICVRPKGNPGEFHILTKFLRHISDESQQSSRGCVRRVTEHENESAGSLGDQLIFVL